MTWLRACCIAFSTYSKIPMPQVAWEERNMRYSLCFFPLVGVVIGALLALWVGLCNRMGIHGLLKGAIGALIPLLVSGGIHMDGFMDTVDALASHADRAKKLQILKDSRVGAFGAMAAAGYMLLMAGAVSELKGCAFAVAFVVSRALSALALVSMPCASTGLLKMFSGSAARKTVRVVSVGYALAFGALGAWLSPMAGAAGLLTVVAALWFYHRMAMRQFGGLAGDLAGWFSQLCEVVYLLCFALEGNG